MVDKYSLWCWESSERLFVSTSLLQALSGLKWYRGRIRQPLDRMNETSKSTSTTFLSLQLRFFRQCIIYSLKGTKSTWKDKTSNFCFGFCPCFLPVLIILPTANIFLLLTVSLKSWLFPPILRLEMERAIILTLAVVKQLLPDKCCQGLYLKFQRPGGYFVWLWFFSYSNSICFQEVEYTEQFWFNFRCAKMLWEVLINFLYLK